MKIIRSLKSTGVLLLFLFGIILLSCGNKYVKKNNKYFVSLKGSDVNNGSSKAPFRTIKKGVSLLQAGDTLIVEPGNYGSESAIHINKSGSKGSPIVVLAEKAGTVFLNGPRKENEVDGPDSLKDGENGTAILVSDVSYVVIDGFDIRNYLVGIDVGVWKDDQLKYTNILNKPHNITIKNCTFEYNGKDGIQVFRVDSVLISNCSFISKFIMEEENGETYPNAVQDYGCNFYSSTASVVENCYFYGSHNQALSFKEGDVDCVARRNIFEGAPLYTGIYLGQNKIADNTEENKNPTCRNLIAEYNIVRAAEGFRVKSPIRADNVENAIIRNNYFEGFDKTKKTGGISVFDEAKGKIEITNNILAFSVNKDSSAGIYVMENLSPKTQLFIKNNTFYDLAKDIKGELSKKDTYEKNIIFECGCYLKRDRNNFYGNPKFIESVPKQLPIATSPLKPDFDEYYFKLTKAFILSENSPAKGFGASLLLK